MSTPQDVLHRTGSVWRQQRPGPPTVRTPRSILIGTTYPCPYSRPHPLFSPLRSFSNTLSFSLLDCTIPLPKRQPASSLLSTDAIRPKRPPLQIYLTFNIFSPCGQVPSSCSIRIPTIQLNTGFHISIKLSHNTSNTHANAHKPSNDNTATHNMYHTLFTVATFRKRTHIST